jgi:hypothetical protein
MRCRTGTGVGEKAGVTRQMDSQECIVGVIDFQDAEERERCEQARVPALGSWAALSDRGVTPPSQLIKYGFEVSKHLKFLQILGPPPPPPGPNGQSSPN